MFAKACNSHLTFENPGAANAVVEALLDCGADVNRQDKVDMSPLMTSARDTPLFKLLLQRGADVTCVGPDGFTVLHALVMGGGEDSNEDEGAPDVTLIKLCLEAGADPDAAAEGGITPLHMACTSGAWGHGKAAAAVLLAGGANVNSIDSGGQTPLYYANSRSRFSGFTGIPQMLLEAGADPTIGSEG